MTYKDLNVWQKSMELVDEIYSLVKMLPKEETYALSDQMRRAVVSVPSNIAEGFKRNSDRDFIHFLSISNGSTAELETQLIIANRQNFLSEEQTKKALGLCEETEKMLSTLIGNIKRKIK